MKRQLKQKDIPTIRAIILEQQNGLCPICSRKIYDPCLDHEHKKRLNGSGHIRGVLCRTCNSFLAKSENNSIRYKIDLSNLPNILRAMADYLEKDQQHIIHPSERKRPKKLQKQVYNRLKKKWKANPDRKRKFPSYPKSGRLTKELKELFERYEIEPEFYK